MREEVPSNLGVEGWCWGCQQIVQRKAGSVVGGDRDREAVGWAREEDVVLLV
jgi:hypothetical protein